MKNALRPRRAAVFVRQVVELAFEKRLFTAAGALAYFLILSVFPLLICVNFFIGALDIDLRALLSSAAPLLPDAGLAILNDYADYLAESRSPAMLWAGLLGLLFSASAAFRQLLAVTDGLYGRRRPQGLRRWAVSVAFSVLLLAAISCSVFVLFTGGRFLQILARLFPGLTVPRDWSWLRFLMLFCFLLFFVLVVYRLSAPPQARAPLFPGAVAASAALVAASAVFSLFLERSSRYSLVYGSLASVIILLVWLYLCGCILLLGCVVNCSLFRMEAHFLLDRNGRA